MEGSDMLGLLTSAIDEAGRTTELLAMPDGSRLLLLPYGARALALATADDDESFFWFNPLLGQGDTARELFGSTGWHNTGGDRTWIAPELDLFFPDAAADRYVQPRELDMSPYAVERIGGGVELSREMRLHLARPNRDAALRLAKWFGPAPNPLRHERDMAAADAVRYAGYTQRTTLESLGDPDGDPPGVGIWNLIQLPPGGQMLVPWYAATDLQPCFGRMPAGSVSVEDRLLRVKIDFAGSHKIALKAAAVCGRAGYAYGAGDRWSLVVRNFFVNPSGAYVDVQKHDPEDFGYAVQICRVDEPEFGSFCELEYHAPGLGDPFDPSWSEDVSQVWAFRGPREAIDAVAHKLLGAGI
jgi:hypothetical protein